MLHRPSPDVNASVLRKTVASCSGRISRSFILPIMPRPMGCPHLCRKTLRLHLQLRVSALVQSIMNAALLSSTASGAPLLASTHHLPPNLSFPHCAMHSLPCTRPRRCCLSRRQRSAPAYTRDLPHSVDTDAASLILSPLVILLSAPRSFRDIMPEAPGAKHRCLVVHTASGRLDQARSASRESWGTTLDPHRCDRS